MLKLLKIIWGVKGKGTISTTEVHPSVFLCLGQLSSLFTSQTYHNFPHCILSAQSQTYPPFFPMKSTWRWSLSRQWCLLVVCCFPFIIDCLCSLWHILFPHNQSSQNIRDLVPLYICRVWGHWWCLLLPSERQWNLIQWSWNKSHN